VLSVDPDDTPISKFSTSPGTSSRTRRLPAKTAGVSTPRDSVISGLVDQVGAQSSTWEVLIGRTGIINGGPRIELRPFVAGICAPAWLRMSRGAVTIQRVSGSR
jgi:hypothetical protein